MISGVYCYTNKINGKKYIGCSKDIEHRHKRHIMEASNPNIVGYNFSIHRAFRKYGIESFELEILERTEDIFNREKYWVEKLDTHNNGYNETPGGDCGPVRAGETNGMAKLTEKDVIAIRTRLLAGEMRGEVYEDYKEKIKPRGFEHVWTGSSWANVMPEAIEYVKSKEYLSKVRSYAAKKGRK